MMKKKNKENLSILNLRRLLIQIIIVYQLLKIIQRDLKEFMPKLKVLINLITFSQILRNIDNFQIARRMFFCFTIKHNLQTSRIIRCKYKQFNYFFNTTVVDR